jgi:hypothetical protein
MGYGAISFRLPDRCGERSGQAKYGLYPARSEMMNELILLLIDMSQVRDPRSLPLGFI